MTTNPARAERVVGPILLGSVDHVWSMLRDRFAGLGQDEYLWEPVPGCWTVREDPSGAVAVDRVFPDPDPAPVTTIAWRLWHIGSEVLAGYTENGLGPRPIAVQGNAWYLSVDEALAAVDEAWAAFRSGLEQLGEDGLWQPLGPAWGPFAEEPWVSLVLHAQDELPHHGAEVALLRDLYAHRPDGRVGLA